MSSDAPRYPWLRSKWTQYLLDVIIVAALIVWVRVSVTWTGYLVAILFAISFFITRVAQQSIRSKFTRDVYVRPPS